MKLAIIGGFGTRLTHAHVAGPQRVAYGLTHCLIADGTYAYDLFDLDVARNRTHRAAKKQTGLIEIQGLGLVNRSSTRACLSSIRHYSVVHFLGTMSLYTLPLLLRLRWMGVPTVVTLNGLYKTEREMGYPYPWPYVWAEAIGLHLASRVVTVSENFQQLVEESYPICRGKTTTIEHGVPEFAVGIGRTSPSVKFDILNAGGTRQVKGIPFLLEALLRGWSPGDAPHWVLVGPPGDEHAEVIKRSIALRDRFNYLGAVTTDVMSDLYRSCKMYIQPSRYEPFGMAILEAMAYGKPVIITRQCGLARLIRDGDNGFVVDHGDITGLIARIRQLMTNEGLGQHVGEQARMTVQPYTWERAATRYVAVYQQVINQANK